MVEHHVAGFRTNNLQLFHKFNDGKFHISKDASNFKVGHNDCIVDILHEIFLLECVFIEDDIVQGQSEKHGDELIVLCCFLQMRE